MKEAVQRCHVAHGPHDPAPSGAAVRGSAGGHPPTEAPQLLPEDDA